MTDEQILQRLTALVGQVLETSASYHSKLVNPRATAGTPPSYYPGYLERIALRDRIRVHAELGQFPEHLFRQRAPRQSQEELDYLRANYKQTTLPVYLDYLATVSRVFHDANWSVSFREGEGANTEDTLEDYVTELPTYGTLETYFRQYLPHQVSVDANGLLVLRPHTIPTQEIEREDGTIELVIGAELLEPLPYFYRCDQVVAEEPGRYYLVELDERAPVRYSNATRAIGRVFEYYDAEVVARATQVGDYTAGTYRYEIVYRHDWGRVPARKAGGIPQVREGVLSYLSPFAFAVDVLDVALLNEQYLNAITSATVYPHRVMYGDPCEFENMDGAGQRALCDGGRFYDSALQGYKTCTACGGSGLRSRLSPLGVLLIKPPSSTQPGDTALPGEPLKFVAPDTDAPRFILEKIARDEQKARRILHLHTSADTAPGGSDPLATGMLLDQKAQEAFLKPISDNLFTHLDFALQAMGWLRYGEQAPDVVVTYPTSFDFLTEQDYLQKISEATKAGLPPFLVQTVLYRYLQSLYYNDAETSRVFETIVHADRLLPYNAEQLAVLEARGLASNAEVILHQSALTLVEELRRADPTYLELPLEERVRILREHAATRVPGAAPAAPGTPQTSAGTTAEQAVAAVLTASTTL